MTDDPRPTPVWDLYGAYLEAPPEQVFEWHDPPTGARGWLVINQLKGGAAGGGTRMRAGVTREEVTYLAKAMQLKFEFSGPPIGGAKSGIDFDPEDVRSDDVLRRWYHAIHPFLATRYGTGGDVGVDEQRRVVPLCAEIGLRHPQEGVVRGHLGVDDGGVDTVLDSLRAGLRQAAGQGYGVEGLEFTVSDLITGYGVSRAASRLYEARGGSLEGARVVVEGFGNVGGAAALYLTRAGARVVGLVDRDAGLISPEGLDPADIEDLLRRRRGPTLPDHPGRVEGAEKEFAYRGEADLFVPAAISDTVDARRLDQLHRHGVRAIVCGANQPFRESERGSTDTARAADERFDVVPDFISSQGMAAAFHYLMRHTDGSSAEDIFEAVGRSVDRGVDRALERVRQDRGGVLGAALAAAVDRSPRLVGPSG